MLSLKQFCKNGHDKAICGKVYPNGDKYCGTCKRESTGKLRRKKAQEKSKIGTQTNYKPPVLQGLTKPQLLVAGAYHAFQPETPLEDFYTWLRFYTIEFAYDR